MKSLRHILGIGFLAGFSFVGLPAAPAQDFMGAMDSTGANTMDIDRFGNPVFGLRAQREPELRRLRAQAGRPILQGRVNVFDVTSEEVETALNNRRMSKLPKIACDEVDGEITCTAN